MYHHKTCRPGQEGKASLPIADVRTWLGAWHVLGIASVAVCVLLTEGNCCKLSDPLLNYTPIQIHLLRMAPFKSYALTVPFAVCRNP
jgi:hypothetical protein